MNRRFFSLLLLLLPVGLCAYAQEYPGQEVQALEAEWLRAYEQNDTLLMHKIVAPDFAITFPNGMRQSKEDLMQLVRANAGKTAGLKLYTEQTTVTNYAGTVVLRGIVVSEFTSQGQKQQHKQYYTDTWVKTSSGWQVVASHLSDVPKEKTTPTKEK